MKIGHYSQSQYSHTGVGSQLTQLKMPKKSFAAMSRRDSIDCKVYVGDLARDTLEKDLERAFSYYGPLRSVWVARNPSGFAFVEFEDPRDADDAVRGLDGS